MSKIKIFLGGYINQRRAQDLNCLALATHLDKSKFEVYTMISTKSEANIDYIRGECTIYTFHARFRFTKMWNYIKALYNCDIIYLAKLERRSLITTLNLIFKKKIILTVENLFDDFTIKQMDSKGSRSSTSIINVLKKNKHVYSLSTYIKIFNEEKHNLKTNDVILPLGVDNDIFYAKNIKKKELKNIIFIGNNMKHKRVYEYLDLARKFNNLTFHIIGNGDEVNLKKLIKYDTNIKHHGSLNSMQINKVFENIDLHISTSKSEGLPKVTFETASAGIPSIIYNTYGGDYFIDNNKNGFLINNFDEMNNKVDELIHNKDLLYENSLNAVKLGKLYSWKNIINIWEKEIENIYNLKGSI